MAHTATPKADFSSSADINMHTVWITAVLGVLIVTVIVLFSMASFQFMLNYEHQRKVLDKPNVVNTIMAEQNAVIAPTIDEAMAETASAYAAEAPTPVHLPADDHAGHNHELHRQ